MLLFGFSDTSGAIRHWVLCQSIKVEGQQPLGTWVLFRLCWLPQGETGGVLAASQCLFSTPFSQPPYCISSTVCRAEPGCFSALPNLSPARLLPVTTLCNFTAANLGSCTPGSPACTHLLACISASPGFRRGSFSNAASLMPLHAELELIVPTCGYC